MKYKIIIPKEEPKQDFYKIGNFHELCDDSCKYHCTKGNTQLADCLNEPKQETLEEVAETFLPHSEIEHDTDFIIGFIAGAKWQAERMYSEEEVEKAYIDAYHKGYNVGQKDAELHPLALTIADNIHKDKKEWFEQFKKK